MANLREDYSRENCLKANELLIFLFYLCFQYCFHNLIKNLLDIQDWAGIHNSSIQLKNE